MEYGLIVALIVLVTLTAIGSVATKTISMWNDVSAKVATAVSGTGT